MECSLFAIVISTLLTGSSPCVNPTSDLYDHRGVEANTVAQLLQEEGYKAKLGTDNVGDPMIETSYSGIPTYIFFYDCDDGFCSDLQFHAYWTLDTEVSPLVMAAWNEKFRFGTAYLDEEGDAAIDIDLQLISGGNDQLIVSYLDLAEIVLSDFEDHIFSAIESPDVHVPGNNQVASEQRDI